MELEGKMCESGGAVVTPEYAIAYFTEDKSRLGGCSLTTWGGKLLTEDVSIIASWHTPRSCVSGEMFQVAAIIDGVRYTGRTCGEGMIWKGKRTAQQPS